MDVTDGKANLTYSLAGYSARTYNVTCVFSKKDYPRAEANSTLTVKKGTYKMDPVTFTATSEETVQLKLFIYDQYNQRVSGITKVAIKISNKTIVTSQATNGLIYVGFKFPYLPSGKLELNILLGNNFRYDFMKTNFTCNIIKQNVSARIIPVTTKAGRNVTLKAILLNTKTNTNVVNGKFIFKVNGTTAPLTVNNTRIYTTKIVDNAVALWTYTVPDNFKPGTYDVTIAYNGNTQSNPIKYTSKALTIIN